MWTTLHFTSHRKINDMRMAYNTNKHQHRSNGICFGYTLTTVTGRKQKGSESPLSKKQVLQADVIQGFG